MLRPTDWASRRVERPEVLPWRAQYRRGVQHPSHKQQISACMTGGRALQQFCRPVWTSSQPPRQAVRRRVARALGLQAWALSFDRGGVLGGRQYRSEQRLCCSAPMHGVRSVGYCEQHPRELSTRAYGQSQQQRFALTGSSVPSQVVSSPDVWGSSGPTNPGGWVLA